MQNFLRELRRRNVPRVAAAYSLSAWILIEAGSVLLPTFGASENVFRIYVLVVVTGFVVSVVLAWVFEWTPEGVKLDRSVDERPASQPRSHQKMNYAIIGLLVIALAVSITFNVREVSPPSHRSVAVLPFASRSTNPDNELFATGMHDELLTRLAGIKALRVISRTSVMGYRNTTKNLREIGAELGVETVLEGSVQQIGDAVRINLQLMDATNDENLWAATYEDELTIKNVFAVQSQISEAVAAALKATLSPDEKMLVKTIPTSDLRAFRLYGEARNNLYQRRLETLREAREQFSEAIALDPKYAEAYAGLAEATLLLLINHSDLPQQDAIRVASSNLERALALDPNLADAYAVLGLLKTTIWSHAMTGGENVEAETAFNRALAINANHASAYMWFASLRDAEERLDDAIALYQKALDVDPLARIPYSNLPQIYAKKGEHAEAMKLWLEAVRIHSDWPVIYQYISVELCALGRLDEAYAWDRKARELTADPSIAGDMQLSIFADLGDFDRVTAILDTYSETSAFHPAVAAFKAYLDEDFAEASRLFAELAEVNTIPGKFANNLASDTALLAGDFNTAKDYALRVDPILAGDTATRINRVNARNAVKLAFIEQREGRGRAATELLLQTLDVIRDLPRLGTYGYGIRDVQIYALLGRKEDALTAFREALDAGFRGSLMFDGWPLYLDPYLDSIRNDPRFVAMLDELEGDLEVMRGRLYRAEAADDYGSLRAMARRT